MANFRKKAKYGYVSNFSYFLQPENFLKFLILKILNFLAEIYFWIFWLKIFFRKIFDLYTCLGYVPKIVYILGLGLD